jgi:hypothetical protein
MTAQYRLLCPHYLNGIMLVADDIVTEGTDVPNGWVPTLAVDPLNSDAVSAYYAAGPRDGGIFEDDPGPGRWGSWRNGRLPPAPPTTFWQRVRGTNTYKLTGLGIGRLPVG